MVCTKPRLGASERAALDRDRHVRAEDDEVLRAGWLVGKTHPLTGQPLRIERLSAPEGNVVEMHTHAVTPRQPSRPVRWCVVYAIPLRADG